MVENLKRLREPVTWAVIVVVAAFIVLSVVRLTLAMTTGMPMGAAFADIAHGSINLTVVVLLVTLVCACLFIAPPTPNAVKVTGVAATVVTLGTVLTLVATVLGVWANAGGFSVLLELIGAFLDVALKLLATGSLWVIFRAVRAGRMQTDPAAIEPPEPPAEEDTTVWQPNRARASAWTTAAEAADGQPGEAEAPAVPPQVRPGAAAEIGWRPPRAGGTAPESSPADTP